MHNSDVSDEIQWSRQKNNKKQKTKNKKTKLMATYVRSTKKQMNWTASEVDLP